MKNQMSSKPMRTRPEYRDHTGPPGFAEKPVCTETPLCEGCPFPSHGFLCQGGDGECMRQNATLSRPCSAANSRQER